MFENISWTSFIYNPAEKNVHSILQLKLLFCKAATGSRCFLSCCCLLLPSMHCYTDTVQRDVRHTRMSAWLDNMSGTCHAVRNQTEGSWRKTEHSPREDFLLLTHRVTCSHRNTETATELTCVCRTCRFNRFNVSHWGLVQMHGSVKSAKT